MDQPVTPYSKLMFPTLKSFCDVLNREKKEVDLILKNISFNLFLERSEATINQYFESEKLDCTVKTWETCARRIDQLFLTENNREERELLEQLNKRVHDQFHRFQMKKYSSCEDDFQERLNLQMKCDCFSQKCFSPIEINAMHPQKILRGLVVEDKYMKQIPLYIEKEEEKKKIYLSLKEKGVNFSAPLKGFELKMSHEEHPEVKKIFKKYPGIIFSNDATIFKILKSSDVLKCSVFFKNKKNQQDAQVKLIHELAYAVLTLYSDSFKDDETTDVCSKVFDKLLPFYSKASSDCEKIKKIDAIEFYEKNLSDFYIESARENFYFWNLLKNKQNAFFNFLIENLGNLVEKHGPSIIPYTVSHGKQQFPISLVSENEVSGAQNCKKYFESKLHIFEENQVKQKPIPSLEAVGIAQLPSSNPKKPKKPKKSKVRKISSEAPAEQIVPPPVIDHKTEQLPKKTLLEKATNVVTAVIKVVRNDPITPPISQSHLSRLTATTNSIPKTLATGRAHPGEPCLFNIHSRVRRWERHDYNELLSKEIFSDPEHEYWTLPEDSMKWMMILHNPHHFVKNYALSLGRKEDWWSQEKQEYHTRYSIPGIITWRGKSVEGELRSTVDQQNVLYHQCFEPKENIAEIQYPSLWIHQQKRVYGDTIVIEKDNGDVKMIDHDRELVLELFKAKE